MIRQGDVLLIKVEQIPLRAGVTPKKDKIVLAGEISGHNHTIQSGQVLLLEKRPPEFLRDTSKDLVFAYLKLEEPTQMIHPEHKAVHLDSGLYEVRRQRERSWTVTD